MSFGDIDEKFTSVWLWSFFNGGLKLVSFWPKITVLKGKLSNIRYDAGLSKIGHEFRR